MIRSSKPDRLVQQCDVVQNPAATATNGLPWYIHVRNTGQAQYTQGGLIRGNTAGGVGSSITANSLNGTQFLNNGMAAPFNFGTVDGTNPNVCYAGCSNSAKNVPTNTVPDGRALSHDHRVRLCEL